MSTLTKNIIFIDDTDPAIDANTTVNVIGIQVIPTGATHTVLLKDGDGNTFYESNENCLHPSLLAKPLKVKGIRATTLTTARVIIWIEA